MACDPTSSTAAREAEWWQGWRGLDFSWQGLAARPGNDSATLQDYWRNEAGRLIAEPGTARQWTRFHCPLTFADGSPSPKALWTADDWRDLHQSLRTRLAMSTSARPGLLDGVVLDALLEGETELPDEADYLWVQAANVYIRGDVDLSHNGWGLADFAGAWFGGKVDLTGARLLDSDFTPARFVLQAVAQDQVREVAAPVVVETVAEVQPSPKRRLGKWAVIGLVAAVAVAGIIWLIRSA